MSGIIGFVIIPFGCLTLGAELSGALVIGGPCFGMAAALQGSYSYIRGSCKIMLRRSTATPCRRRNLLKAELFRRDSAARRAVRLKLPLRLSAPDAAAHPAQHARPAKSYPEGFFYEQQTFKYQNSTIKTTYIRQIKIIKIISRILHISGEYKGIKR